jgi:hypothetical protein
MKGKILLFILVTGIFVFLMVGCVITPPDDFPPPEPPSAPVVKQLAEAKPCGIAVDDTHVYWTEGCASESIVFDGTIWKVPIAGGTPVRIADSLNHPAKITVHGGYVYWTEWGLQMVRKMAVDGGPIFNIGQQVGSSHSRPAVRGNYVYWNDGKNVKRSDINTAVQQNVTQFPNDPAYDVKDFALDTNFVYFTRWRGGFVQRRQISPAAGLVLVMNPTNPNTGLPDDHPAAIAFDGTYVYWGEHRSNTGFIKRIPQNGGAVDIIDQNVVNIYDLAVDNNYVYWTGGLAPQNTKLYRKPKSGILPVIQIATLVSMQTDVIARNGKIFWGDPAQGVFVAE